MFKLIYYLKGKHGWPVKKCHIGFDFITIKNGYMVLHGSKDNVVISLDSMKDIVIIYE